MSAILPPLVCSQWNVGQSPPKYLELAGVARSGSAGMLSALRSAPLRGVVRNISNRRPNKMVRQVGRTYAGKGRLDWQCG